MQSLYNPSCFEICIYKPGKRCLHLHISKRKNPHSRSDRKERKDCGDFQMLHDCHNKNNPYDNEQIRADSHELYQQHPNKMPALWITPNPMLLNLMERSISTQSFDNNPSTNCRASRADLPPRSRAKRSACASSSSCGISSSCSFAK